jgi:hypothetical protein
VKLSKNQLKALSQITADIGQAFFVSSFVPFLIGLEQQSIIVVLLLLIVSVGCWIMTIILAGGLNND